MNALVTALAILFLISLLMFLWGVIAPKNFLKILHVHKIGRLRLNRRTNALMLGSIVIILFWATGTASNITAPNVRSSSSNVNQAKAKSASSNPESPAKAWGGEVMGKYALPLNQEAAKLPPAINGATTTKQLISDAAPVCNQIASDVASAKTATPSPDAQLQTDFNNIVSTYDTAATECQTAVNADNLPLLESSASELTQGHTAVQTFVDDWAATK